MNLLDRHIFKNVLLACAGTVALFTFVLVLGNVIRDLLSHVLAGQFPLSTLLRPCAMRAAIRAMASKARLMLRDKATGSASLKSLGFGAFASIHHLRH